MGEGVFSVMRQLFGGLGVNGEPHDLLAEAFGEFSQGYPPQYECIAHSGYEIRRRKH